MLPHRRTNAFSIYHPTKPEESLFGADLLLCIRYPAGSGRRLALQAKKLYPTARYNALDHKDASGKRQIDTLDRFAQWWGAVPAYLLYNHVDPLPYHTPYWHCCRAENAEQLGCTIVPTWCIRQAIGSRGGRTFPAIHSYAQSRPWRCVFDCDKPIQQVDELALLQPEPRIAHDKVVFHQQSPDWLQTDSDAFDSLLEIHESLSTEDLRRFLPRLVKQPDKEARDTELTYPRRILVVDVGDFGRERKGE